jgi:hypothetical protein
MRRQPRTLLLVIVAVLLIAQGTLHRTVVFPQWRVNYGRGDLGIAQGLSPDQMLAALAGFREMIAGILWVRADSFFETGNYDAILPIIWIVTRLDPKQVDVFATGMWHIGYNFSDEDQRGDRRYIPYALALGREGARNNPETYELFFENGWMWYHRIDDDYHNAVEWFRQAWQREDMADIPARKNLKAMALQRDGQVSEALRTYFELFDAAQARTEADPNDWTARQNRETIEKNIDTMIVRMVQRGYLGRKQGVTGAIPYDTDPPFDVGFSARVTVEDPRVVRFEGTWNVLPVGTRVRVILRDADFANAVPGGMVWDSATEVALDPPRDLTFMFDTLFVRNRRFNRRIDMSRDPTMYPFTQDNYVVEFYYNPRSAPPHMQDKFGWNGEGLTDQNFLNLEARPGQRVVFTRLELTREMIMREGRWRDEVPVVQTHNFRPPTREALLGDIIRVPGLLAPAR